MSFADVIAKLTLSAKDAEVIFDRDEPIGQMTDMVMPRRRWFRKSAADGSRRTRFPFVQSSLPQ